MLKVNKSDAKTVHYRETYRKSAHTYTHTKSLIKEGTVKLCFEGGLRITQIKIRQALAEKVVFQAGETASVKDPF